MHESEKYVNWLLAALVAGLLALCVTSISGQMQSEANRESVYADSK